MYVCCDVDTLPHVHAQRSGGAEPSDGEASRGSMGRLTSAPPLRHPPRQQVDQAPDGMVPLTSQGSVAKMGRRRRRRRECESLFKADAVNEEV